MNLYEQISASHYIGERLKVYTEWEGDKRWQEVVIMDKFPTYAMVAKLNENHDIIYQFCLNWQTFLETDKVMLGGEN